MNKSQVEKFYTVMIELLENMEEVIGDVNTAHLTSLTRIDVKLIRDYASSLDKKYLIDTFITNSENHWDKILNKDDDFFITKSSDIFGKYANYQQFNAIKVIFSKNDKGISIVDQDTREAIREYIFALIKISIKYIFESKGAVVEKLNDNGVNKIKIVYHNKDVFSNIDIRKHASTWKVMLW